MSMAINVDASVSDDERRRQLYNGDIFILAATPASLALVALAKEMLESAFAPHDPRYIHEYLSAEVVSEILTTLKPKFIHHPECKKLIRQVMEEHDIDLEKLYFDVPRMRSAYPEHFFSSGIAYAFHPHRDTWYSAPMCQINWWLPIYPLDRDNCMGFYPRYFEEPVENNSEIYNYYEWNEKSRAQASQHVKSDTREQPKAQQPLEQVTVRFLPQPGSIILFSGAQLHETVPNKANVARYSIDFRTVHIDDVANRVGAPNLDSRCTGTTMRDYLRASDQAHLPEELIQLYDDGTEVRSSMLYFGDRLAKVPETV